MDVFLFWIILITIVLAGYLYYIYRRSPKGFRFQVKLTIIFILLVLIPAIPLTLFVSGLLTQGVEMLLLPGVEESLSSSLDVIKFQLEERGDIFFNTYSEINQLDEELAAKIDVAYYAHLKSGKNALILSDFIGPKIELMKESPTKNQDVLNSILQNEIKSSLFSEGEGFICEVYRVSDNSSVKVVAYSVDPKIIKAKDRISESLRVYNSLSLFKKSVVEGQIIWGFSTLFIILLAILAIYSAR